MRHSSAVKVETGIPDFNLPVGGMIRRLAAGCKRLYGHTARGPFRLRGASGLEELVSGSHRRRAPGAAAVPGGYCAAGLANLASSIETLCRTSLILTTKLKFGFDWRTMNGNLTPSTSL